MKKNDLIDFMASITQGLEGEYNRIQKRALEDPGTAGDQGEENWATILRNWLPSDYQVVTKGRLINSLGETSPQVDVVVLYPWYPKGLLDKKLYLTAGVAAVFECKTTLKSTDIDKTMNNSVSIRRLYRIKNDKPFLKMMWNGIEKQSGNAYSGKVTWKEEMYSPIIYGLLAHSHSWKAPKSKPRSLISQKIVEFDKKYIKHPRECLDFLCVSDLATWYSTKTPMKPNFKIGENTVTVEWLTGPVTTYSMNNREMFPKESIPYESSSPIGVLLTRLLRRMTLNDSRISEFSDYFSKVLSTNGDSVERLWDEQVLSKPSRKKLEGHTKSLNFDWLHGM